MLVNGAGMLVRGPAEDLSAEPFRDVLDVNLLGPFLCAREVIPGMKARGRGRIVNVASISGTLGTPLASPYNASKWGLIGLTKCLAEELRPSRVQCLAVSPGQRGHRDARPDALPAADDAGPRWRGWWSSPPSTRRTP